MSFKAATYNSTADINHRATATGADCEIKMSQWEAALDWNALFNNVRPVEIEIGCGRGMFIIKHALQNPALNFLGIEKSARFFHLLKERVVKSKAENIKLIRGEAGYLMKKFVPADSVQAIHIYFPDPWPKKRHRKRRLINGTFLESVARILLPDGRLFIATDFQDYFNEIITIAPSCCGLARESYEELSQQDVAPDTAATAYERKYLKQGRTIYRTVYKRI